MKSYYLKEHDAFVRYFDLAADPQSADQPVRVYISGLSTPSTAGLLHVAQHRALRGHRALLIDYIGSGFSDKVTNFDHAMQHHAAYIAQILDHEQVADVQFIGHSMGGTVGIYLAQQRPDLVSKLVIAEGNLAPGGGPGTRYIANFSESEWLYEQYPLYMTQLNQRARSGNASAIMVAGAWQDVDPYGIYWQSQSLVNLPADFMTQVAELACDVTFIYGDANLPANNNGEIWPDSPEPDTLREIGIAIGIVENSSHMMMVDNLDGFAHVIANALHQ